MSQERLTTPTRHCNYCRMYKPEQDFQPSQWEIPTAVYCRDCMKRMAEHLPRPSDMLAAYVDGKWTPVER